MSLTGTAIEKRKVTYFVIFLLIVAGIGAFFSLGQLEDPEFTVKTAVITTTYPGASPLEVEQEVTDRIELAIQEMPQIDYVESSSKAGLSQISVELKAQYWSDQLPQVWDELRRKIRNIEGSLPPGAGRPDVSDDFGDVYGFQLTLVGDGFSNSEMETYAKEIKKELSLVPNVARIDLWGVQERIIYIEISQTQLSELGLTNESISNTLEQQNMIVDAGSLDMNKKRLRIAPTGEFKSPQDIADLQIAAIGSGNNEELIRIRDVATVIQGYKSPPSTIMHYNGMPAIGISITNVSGVNVVKVGQGIDKRLDEIIAVLPVGIEVNRIHWQSEIVDDAVKAFLINFGEAVAIVLVVLTIAMGWRMGIIIGSSLILTILASFILMAIFGIDLQRMSLGALVIALGMMVDNSIVVADGIVSRIQAGMDRKKAAIEAASQPAMPLLGATVIAVMAFYPIFASTEGAGEYCRTLFTVVAISLLVSWLISMTITPLQCIDMLPKIKPDGDNVDPYGSRFYSIYKGLLGKALKLRILTIASLVGLLFVSLIGFGKLDQMFFPDSSMTKFMIDYWAPEGTRIQTVASDLKKAEQKIIADERVDSVSSFIGAGPPRFYLPVDPESPYQSYAQLIVNVKNFKDINGYLRELDAWFKLEYPQALVPIRPYGVGPSNTWKFELRISGPSNADSKTLRTIGQRIVSIVQQDPLCAVARTNWRQQVQKVVPEYNQERGRWANITRQDIADTTKRAYDGLSIGIYREKDDVIPIVMRHKDEERKSVSNINILQVQPKSSTYTIPLSQVTDKIKVAWEDPLVWRRDRRPTITIEANPIFGVTLPALRSSVLDKINEVKLPPGYTMEWGGEYEDTVKSQASLIPGMVPALAIVLLIIVLLFNAYRPLMIILFTVPFALIGIVAGLLPTGTPFGFLALLGGMSLVGMMIKNAIVLLDQINIELAAGKSPYKAVIESALSRLRPVVLAAATTVLGVIPLLQDVFWVGMAITIMAGLTFGTILTMIVVPVFYCMFYKIKQES